MIAEGNETPGGESGGAAESRGRRGEGGDLLAERRARRAAESGEHALTLRAEAAEATVRTLETHVASLQQRLSDSEQEIRRIADLLDAERAPRHGGQAEVERRPEPSPPRARESALERELQRASQREYAEQRLRVEAEDRSIEVERESRAEVERLTRLLSASEREAQALGARLEIVERELAEAEQIAATERSAMLRTERVLRSRVSELEGTALELHGALEAERAARRRAEYLLDALRDAQRSALGLIGGLADTIARLRDATVAAVAPPLPVAPPPPPPPVAPAAPQSSLRPPALEAISAGRSPMPRSPERTGPTPVTADPAHGPSAPAAGRSAEMAEALAAAVERLRARAEEQDAQPGPPATTRPAHKHSMSLITRTRLALGRRRERRKQRRER